MKDCRDKANGVPKKPPAAGRSAASLAAAPAAGAAGAAPAGADWVEQRDLGSVDRGVYSLSFEAPEDGDDWELCGACEENPDDILSTPCACCSRTPAVVVEEEVMETMWQLQAANQPTSQPHAIKCHQQIA